MKPNATNPFDADGFDGDEFVESGGSERSPITVVLRELRGRYLMTAALGALFAVIFGIAGYKATSPKYTSHGAIRIAPTRNVILYENELNEKMGSFDSFVRSQVLLIESPRMINAALEDPALAGSDWPARPQGADLLSKLLDVQHERRGENIVVSVTHAEPQLAHRATNAVLDAYMRIATEKAVQEFGSRETELIAVRDEYAREYDNAVNQALRIAETNGTSDLEMELSAKRDELARLDSMVNSLQLATDAYAAPAEGETVAKSDGPVSIDELKRFDEPLARAVTQRNSIELRRDSLATSGMMAGHREMRRVLSELEAVNRFIDERARTLRAEIDTGSLRLPAEGLSPEAGTFRQDVQRLASAKKLRDQLSEEVIRLGRAHVRINYYNDRADDYAKLRDQADTRLETFRVEGRAKNVGRMELAFSGSLPTSPSVDRRKPLAAIGALGGCGLGVASVLAMAFIRPRYRHVEDVANDAGDVILGMIPDFDADMEGVDEVASVSIHRIRGILDAQSHNLGRRASVHTVLSSTAGEGKTNLAFGLASSFAKTGKRTLLIDADLIAPSVSAELGLGEAPGLVDAIRSGHVNGEITQTATPNFYVLPAGVKAIDQGNHEIADMLSRHNLNVLIEQLNNEFDEIIIDTGPLLGSTESVACAAVADGVIFVVGRNQSPSRVRTALDHLRMLGVGRVGVVFNRASSADLMRSSLSVISQRSVSVMRETGGLTSPARKFIELAASKKTGTGD